jgi:DNA topoisomerase IB
LPKADAREYGWKWAEFEGKSGQGRTKIGKKLRLERDENKCPGGGRLLLKNVRMKADGSLQNVWIERDEGHQKQPVFDAKMRVFGAIHPQIFMPIGEFGCLGLRPRTLQLPASSF